jgi:hypothetical protein
LFLIVGHFFTLDRLFPSRSAGRGFVVSDGSSFPRFDSASPLPIRWPVLFLAGGRMAGTLLLPGNLPLSASGIGMK